MAALFRRILSRGRTPSAYRLRRVGVDGAQELKELGAAMPPVCLADHRASGDVHDPLVRSKKGYLARTPFGMPTESPPGSRSRNELQQLLDRGGKLIQPHRLAEIPVGARL